MQSPALNELLRSVRFTNGVLWATLTLSIVIYVVVAWMVASQRAEPRVLDPILELALTAKAFVLAGASLLLPRILLSDDRIRASLSKATAGGPDATPTTAIHPNAVTRAALESVPEHERGLAALPALYFTPFILRLVLNESVAILGLVLSFVSGRVEPLLPFALAAIVLNLLSLPRLDPLIERARMLGGGAGAAL